MLNYALILLVVVLLFISLKNTEGLAAGEEPIKKNNTEEYLLQIDKQPFQYKLFAETIQNQCAYYDSGNNINHALNQFTNDSIFTNKIITCYNNFSTDEDKLHSCYATHLNSYVTPAGVQTGAADYIRPCINSFVIKDKVTTFAELPKLESASKDAIPVNMKQNTNTVQPKGWDFVNFILTNTCAPHNSLKEIDDALAAGKKAAMSKLGGPGGCIDATINRI